MNLFCLDREEVNRLPRVSVTKKTKPGANQGVADEKRQFANRFGYPGGTILYGLAVGYHDPDFPANKPHIGREAIEKNVAFMDS